MFPFTSYLKLPEGYRPVVGLPVDWFQPPHGDQATYLVLDFAVGPPFARSRRAAIGHNACGDDGRPLIAPSLSERGSDFAASFVAGESGCSYLAAFPSVVFVPSEASPDPDGQRQRRSKSASGWQGRRAQTCSAIRGLLRPAKSALYRRRVLSLARSHSLARNHLARGQQVERNRPPSRNPRLLLVEQPGKDSESGLPHLEAAMAAPPNVA